MYAHTDIHLGLQTEGQAWSRTDRILGTETFQRNVICRVYIKRYKIPLYPKENFF